MVERARSIIAPSGSTTLTKLTNLCNLSGRRKGLTDALGEFHTVIIDKNSRMNDIKFFCFRSVFSDGHLYRSSRQYRENVLHGVTTLLAIPHAFKKMQISLTYTRYYRNRVYH
jgi:hypothetical protein